MKALGIFLTIVLSKKCSETLGMLIFHLFLASLVNLVFYVVSFSSSIFVVVEMKILVNLLVRVRLLNHLNEFIIPSTI